MADVFSFSCLSLVIVSLAVFTLSASKCIAYPNEPYIAAVISLRRGAKVPWLFFASDMNESQASQRGHLRCETQKETSNSPWR